MRSQNTASYLPNLETQYLTARTQSARGHADLYSMKDLLFARVRGQRRSHWPISGKSHNKGVSSIDIPIRTGISMVSSDPLYIVYLILP